MENKDAMRQLGEEELDAVAGGINLNPFNPFNPTGLSFDDCTRELKDAGDRAWLRSECSLGYGPSSPLHTAISNAEHATDTETRRKYVNEAAAELANGPEKVRYVKFQPGDYKFIKDKVDLVYNTLNVKRIMA